MGGTFARISLRAFRLRKKDKRRLWIGLGVASATSALLWIFVPMLVKGRVESAVADRTGLSVTIDSVSVGFGSVTLEKLALR